VLLTRSPLRHPPEGGASLDLHVLSTPPAFVLSQDQTLRVGMYDNRADPDSRHRKLPSWRRCQSLVHPSWMFLLLVCTKGISFTHFGARPSCVDESYFMALTFGTLLSSQGADAHRRDSSEPFRGNPSYATRSVPLGQTTPAPPGFPLGRRTRLPESPGRGASRLGDVRPAPSVPCRSPGRPVVAPCVEQGED
jgi:hypothetical protein